MTNLTQTRNLIVNNKVVITALLLILVLIPLIIFQISKKSASTPTLVEIPKPLDIPQNTSNIKISFTGEPIDIPKRIDIYTLDPNQYNEDQLKVYAQKLGVQSQPKILLGTKDTYIWEENNITLTANLKAQTLTYMKTNPDAKKTNDITKALQLRDNLLETLGININTTLYQNPLVEKSSQAIYNSSQGKPIMTDFLGLAYDQSIDTIPVITSNPNTHAISMTIVFGEVQNMQIDLSLQSPPAKISQQKTLSLPEITKIIESWGGVFISGINPDDHAIYSMKSKQITSVELKSGRVAYFKDFSDTINLIPVVLFEGKATFNSNETRNVRVLAPLTHNYKFTQP